MVGEIGQSAKQAEVYPVHNSCDIYLNSAIVLSCASCATAIHAMEKNNNCGHKGQFRANQQPLQSGGEDAALPGLW